VRATGLDVFDKTLQTTNTWLGEIMDDLGPDRQVAWHALDAVLRALRDRIPLDLAAHPGAELPLLVRGVYCDQWRPAEQPEQYRSLEEFRRRVADNLGAFRPVNSHDAARSVFGFSKGTSQRGRSTKCATLFQRTSGRSGPNVRWVVLVRS
jgi:uncharacterized protein (DUF2267 family)